MRVCALVPPCRVNPSQDNPRLRMASPSPHGEPPRWPEHADTGLAHVHVAMPAMLAWRARTFTWPDVQRWPGACYDMCVRLDGASVSDMAAPS